MTIRIKENKQKEIEEDLNGIIPFNKNDLTEKDIKCLCLIAKGFNQKEIATKESMSVDGVKYYYHQLILKFKAKNIVHAVLKAVYFGVITIDIVEESKRRKKHA